MKTVTVFEIGISGAIAAAERNDICIVIDVLRASSTIITALQLGVSYVQPVITLPKNYEGLSAGEYKGKKQSGFNLGNSPTELFLHQKNLTGKPLLLSSTNGTGCITASVGSDNTVLIGALLNKTAIAHYATRLAISQKKNIALILAGSQENLEADDLIAGMAIANVLTHTELVIPDWFSGLQPLPLSLAKTAAAQRLCELGYSDDVFYCSQEDTTDRVPCLVDGKIILLS